MQERAWFDQGALVLLAAGTGAHSKALWNINNFTEHQYQTRPLYM